MRETTSMTRINASFKTVGFVMLVLGAVAAGVGFAMGGVDPKALQHGYMFGWVYWACLTFGCLGLCLLHHACRGNWGFPVLKIFQAGGSAVNLAVFGLLFLPIALIWRQDFFPWSIPEVVAKDPVLQAKAPYLNDGFWLARTVLYFAVFVFLAWRYKTWTDMEEKTGDERWWKKRQYWGGVSLVVFVVCSNFMWTDWLMSQYPHWYSTIYGVWFVVGSSLLAFALASVILGTQHNKKPYSDVMAPWLTKDMGNWMLTFTMLWAYFSLSQYLIIWSGNLTEFTEFFIQRSTHGWQIIGTGLIPAHFFIPFLLLLSPRMKREPKRLAFVGFYLLAVRAVDVLYVVTPTWKVSLTQVNALDIGFFLLFGGIWCLLFGFQIAQSPLLTWRVPQLKEALDHA